MARAVLFDCDGVLVDSGVMHRATWGAWADLRAIDRELMFTGIHGERGVDTVTRVAPHLETETELALLAELLLEHEEKSVAYPGAAALLTRYAGRCALVTSGPGPATRARLARLGLPVPDVIVCGEDVSAGKPDPEPFLLAARHLGVPPWECVVVEDAPAGIASGRAAGCHVIGLTTSLPAHALSGAHEIVTDLAAVARRLGELVSGQP